MTLTIPPTTLDDAISAACRAHPYYTTAIWRLRFVPDPTVPTMATSANWVTHYNPATLAGWTRHEAGAVIVHELEHLLRDHAGRADGRDHGRWNRAADAEINQRLAGLPDGAIYPESFGMPRGRAAEVYYGATSPQDDPPQDDPGEGDSGEGEGEGSGGSGSGEGQPGGSGSGSGSGEGHGTDCGSCAGGPARDWEHRVTPRPACRTMRPTRSGARWRARCWIPPASSPEPGTGMTSAHGPSR